MHFSSKLSLCAILLITGCGENNKGKQENDNPHLEHESSGSFRDSYQSNDNGCDTGKHEFSASSRDDLKRQICTALQNSELNNWCALDSRRMIFDRKCSGYSWRPF